MRRSTAFRLAASLSLVLLLALLAQGLFAQSRYEMGRFMWQGREVVAIRVGPGLPPPVPPPDVMLPPSDRTMGTNTLANVPAWDWCYGCSATSAAMIAGYYDNLATGQYANMYAGPANGGVCPMNNETTWAAGESPLSATHMGYDGRATRGAVDDYWIVYNNPGPDPYIVNGWIEHTWADCTGDFMGTNQSKYGNVDGATTFYMYTNGDPLYDFSGAEPGSKDGCHGFAEFARSRGYTVASLQAFTQLIYPNSVYGSITHGFTFANFKSEVDAGRPVLIQVEGHTMVGFGYDDTGQLVYLRDTWDHSSHSMTWGGSYSGMTQYAVTCLQLPVNHPPTQPTVDVTPNTPKTADILTCTITGPSTDPDADLVTYDYEWYKGGVHQATYDKLGTYDLSATVPAAATTKGDTWKCVVTPNDGQIDGPSGEDSVTLVNTAPTQPVVDVTPDTPKTDDDLNVALTTPSTDADSDTITYTYKWYLGAVQQGAYDGLTTVPASATTKGDVWKCVVTPNDGSEDGPTGEDQVTVANSPPTAPVVDVTPDYPRTDQDLNVAITTPSTDADSDTVTIGYAWYKDTVHQPAYDGLTTVPHTATASGQTWKCVVTPNDGTVDGATGEDQVTVQNPTLAWAGTVGYETDGVDPDLGDPTLAAPTTFTFKVKYTDPTGNTPLVARCVIQKKGATGWSDQARIAMTVESGAIATGAIYSCATQLPNQVVKYRFLFQAADGTYLTGDPATFHSGRPGVSGCPHLCWTGKPGFETDGVSPDTGPTGTSFVFQVKYMDAAGDAPTQAQVQIRRNGVLWRTLDMSAWPGGSYCLGRIYQRRNTINKAGPGETYEYRFAFADASGAATGDPTNWQSAPTITGAGGAGLTSLAALPTRAGAQVTFSLAGAANVTATVVNVAGRPIRTLVADKPLDAGLQTLVWDRKAASGLTVPAGLYVIRVTAQSAGGGQSTALATVALK